MHETIRGSKLSQKLKFYLKAYIAKNNCKEVLVSDKVFFK